MRRALEALFVLGLVLLAVHVIQRELEHVHYEDVARSARSIPARRVVYSVLLTFAVYAILGAYDLCGLWYVGRRVGKRKALLSAMTALALSQTLGFATLTGSSIRYRFWSAWGLSGGEIGRSLAFVGVAHVLGMLAVNGAFLVLWPGDVASQFGLAGQTVIAIGFAQLAVVGLYLGVVLAFHGRTLRLFGKRFSVPPRRLAFLQLSLPFVDWLCASGAFFVLLDPGSRPSFGAFTAVFTLSQVLAHASHAPGGIGVFDSSMLTLLSSHAGADEIAGKLLVFRGVYYLLPFALGVLALLTYEVWSKKHHVAKAMDMAERLTAAFAPMILAVATFVAGLALLFSGATPATPSRLEVLARHLPLSVIEASHFLGSLVGVLLLVLAWGLRHRLDAAWTASILLLLLGILGSLLKGFDWEEALLLSLVLALALSSKEHFRRRSALFSEPLELEWVVAVVLALGGTVWLGFFTYKHVEYRPELWWQFALDGDAPRSLRAAVGAAVALIAVSLVRMLRQERLVTRPPTAVELDQAQGIAAASPSAMGALALTGDKSLLFSRGGRAFLMYRVVGSTWVALGDPVGDPAEGEELAWRFQSEARRRGAAAVFYEVSAERLPVYIDLGLSFVKLGEEAQVDLTGFTLEGGHGAGLRKTLRDFEALGAEFQVHPPGQSVALLDALEAISDAWLQEKRVREKGFSLGRFDRDYLARVPLAVLSVGGRAVAFASLLLAAPGSELSLDLMRTAAGAPQGAMECLLIRLMLWAKQQGFGRFSLGMAPLSGLESKQHPEEASAAPLWARAANFVFEHGEPLYNFQGLRRFKQKFHPTWQPRYLASPGGMKRPRVLADVATLISGGAAGLFRK